MNQFLAGISEVCFAASYAVALALEISRLFFKSGVRGAVMIGFAAAGLAAHTLFLAHQAMTSTSAPLSSAYSWYLLAAWCLAVVYLYLTWRQPRVAIGLFVLPIVLALVAMAHFWADRAPFPTTEASLVWGLVHGVFLLVGSVAMLVGAAAGVMYLLQARRLKVKHAAPSRLRLPSLEWLERTNQRALWVAVPALAAGLVSGVILNAVNRQRQVDQIPWGDPIVWSLGLGCAGLTAVAVFNRVYKPAQRGHKVAYLTVACGLFLALALCAALLFESQHRGAAGQPSRSRPSPAQEAAR